MISSKEMRIIILVLIIFLATTSRSNEKVLNCKQQNESKISFFNNKFSKIIDLDNKTIKDITGGYNLFDKVIIFGRNEIILKNEMFNTHSTYNLDNMIWTIYSDYFVKLYDCSLNKERAPLW